MPSKRVIKPSAEAFIQSLADSKIINPKTTLADVIQVSGELSRGGAVNKTIVYDDDKYFAIMK